MTFFVKKFGSKECSFCQITGSIPDLPGVLFCKTQLHAMPFPLRALPLLTSSLPPPRSGRWLSRSLHSLPTSPWRRRASANNPRSVRRWEFRNERPGASGGAYIKSLPDTRVTHEDKLIKGENFTDEPGTMAVLEYAIGSRKRVRYYIWCALVRRKRGHMAFAIRARRTMARKRQTLADGEEGRVALGMRPAYRRSPHGRAHAALARHRPSRQTTPSCFRCGRWSRGRSDQPQKGDRIIPESPLPKVIPLQPEGTGAVAVSGDLKTWHKVTLTLDGPLRLKLT